MLTIHESSNPYFNSARITEDGNIIIEWSVDQLFVDPDTNEQQVVTECFEERLKNG